MHDLPLGRKIDGNDPPSRSLLACMRARTLTPIPDTRARRQGSWADGALSFLMYDCAPERLQSGIEAAFVHATSTIKIAGTEVVPFPLFKGECYVRQVGVASSCPLKI